VELELNLAHENENLFRYKAPDAKSVELMGEWNGWKSIPMNKNSKQWTGSRIRLSKSNKAA
jgi:hypothetical protein